MRFASPYLMRTALICMIILFAVFSIHTDKKNRRLANELLEKHAAVIKNDIWNFDEYGPLEYLYLATEHSNYERIVIYVNEYDKPFIAVDGPKLQGIDRFLSSMKLIRRRNLSQAIVNKQDTIGSIQVVHRVKNIYAGLYFILISGMLLLVLKLFSIVSQDKFRLKAAVDSKTQALQKSERNYRRLVTSIPGITYQCACDRDRTMSFMSEEIERLAGYSCSDFLNNSVRSFASIIHEDDRAHVEETVLQAVTHHTPFIIEYRIICADGSHKWVFEKGVGDYDEKSDVLGLSGVIIDISERKKAANDKISLQEQLNHISKLEAIGQLAGGIAHDFNNLLSGIIGASELLKDSQHLDDQERALLGKVIETSERAAVMTRKLLTFSRKSNSTFKPTDVHAVVTDVEEMLKNTIDKTISILIKNNAVTHTISSDESSLQNALINLGINASHAMPEGGTLSFETKNRILNSEYCWNSTFTIEQGEYIEVIVRDTGCGISRDNMDKIFEPFFTTKEQGAGTGLGLSTVYGVVQSHHGEIHCESEEGKGTEFHLLLPCVKSSEQPVQTPQEVIRGTGTILLVDDDDTVRDMCTESMKKMGYSVISAHDGPEAVAIYREKYHTIDCVILDMVMPVWSGKDTLIRLKDLHPQCKVIIATGFMKNEKHSDLKDLGVCGFIKKPFRRTELSQLIHTVLTRN